MKGPIDFQDLYARVSDNHEFAHRMLNNFFESWMDRFEQLESNLNQENYDELADGAHQLKGILGNLAIHRGFDLLKKIHEESRLKNPGKIKKLLDKLKSELLQAQDHFKQL